MAEVLCVLIDHSGSPNPRKSISASFRISISQLFNLKVQSWAPAAFFVVCLPHFKWFNNPNEPQKNVQTL